MVAYTNETYTFTRAVTGEIILSIKSSIVMISAWFTFWLIIKVEISMWDKHFTDSILDVTVTWKPKCRKNKQAETFKKHHLYDRFCDANHMSYMGYVWIRFIDKTDPFVSKKVIREVSLNDIRLVSQYWKPCLIV